MGSEVIAQCSCGLNTMSLVGGGMASHSKTCYFPCYCENCRTVVQANLLAKKQVCPQCKSTNVIPFDDPALSPGDGEHVVAEWNMNSQIGRDLKLTNGNYKCPQCGQMTLSFTDNGLNWD